MRDTGQKLKETILSSNIEEHKKEAKYYDIIHTELYNRYEQKRIIIALHKSVHKFNKNSKILEIGSGTGNLTTKLLDQGFKNLVCVDVSREMMEELKKKVVIYDHNIKFKVSDIDSFLENNNSKYDIVVMSSVLHHLPNYIATLENIKKVLNENSCIYLTHEPLPASNGSLLVKILMKIDLYVYVIRYILLMSIGKLKYLDRNCEYSDYHTGKRAINISKLETVFGDTYKWNLQKYPVAKFGLTSFLLKKLNYVNNFEFTAVKVHDNISIRSNG